jgi:flagellar biosynthesis protein FlhB
MQEIAGAALPKASSLLNILRQIFSSIGTAITATLFLQQTNVHIRELQGGQTANIGTQAATMAVNDVFFLVTIASVIVLFLSFAVPGRMRPKPTLASIPLEPEQALTK